MQQMRGTHRKRANHSHHVMVIIRLWVPSGVCKENAKNEMLAVTDSLQLGLDEPLADRAGHRCQWEHRPRHQLLFQVHLHHLSTGCHFHKRPTP